MGSSSSMGSSSRLGSYLIAVLVTGSNTGSSSSAFSMVEVLVNGSNTGSNSVCVVVCVHTNTRTAQGVDFAFGSISNGSIFSQWQSYW